MYESKTYTNTTLQNALGYTDKLQYMSFEEGRIRPVYTGAQGAFTGLSLDYMLKDHLGNVRMLLTDEVLTTQYPAATMEPSTIGDESKIYSNLSSTQTDKPSWFNDPLYAGSTKVARLKNATGSAKVGPSIILKVMAGDSYNIRVTSGWNSSSTAYNNNTGVLTDLLNQLVNGLPAASGGKATTSDLQQAGTGLTGSLSSYINQLPTGASAPKAYLNWVLLDEQFKIAANAYGSIIASGYSGFDAVDGSGAMKMHVLTNLPVAKSGYLIIYTSNEASNIDVYFDNLQVTHTRGPILEETHYYPFGLTMKGISALSANTLENKRKWNKGSDLQDKEFCDGSGLELYATPLRSLDPQLGRWWQIDSKPDYSQSLYASMGNNPILYNDPLGDTIVVQDANMQKKILKDLGKVYGKKSGYFQFNSSGVLGFTEKGTKSLVGSVIGNMLTSGRIEKVNALANSLAGTAKIMNSTEMTTIVYSNDKLNVSSTHASTGQTQIGVRPTDTGGEITLTKTDNPNGFSVGGRSFDNVIFINPASSSTSIIAATQLYNPSQQLLLQAVAQGGIRVTSQRHSLLMHGLGHVIHQSPMAQPNVIQYDNYNRILSGDALNQNLDGSHQ